MKTLLRRMFGRHRNDDLWTLVPATETEIDAVVRHCRAMANQRAALAAGAAVVPVPGIDWVADVAVLLRLIPDINHAFGLTPGQVERLSPDRRVAVLKAVSAGGSLLVGKLVTRELVIAVLRKVGVRLTVQQAAKFVPIAGQAVSAALTYATLRYVCEQHIRQCVAVSRQLLLPAPQVAESA